MIATATSECGISNWLTWLCLVLNIYSRKLIIEYMTNTALKWLNFKIYVFIVIFSITRVYGIRRLLSNNCYPIYFRLSSLAVFFLITYKKIEGIESSDCPRLFVIFRHRYKNSYVSKFSTETPIYAFYCTLKLEIASVLSAYIPSRRQARLCSFCF